MKQSNFSMNREQIEGRFGSKLEIPSGKKESKLVVIAIGEANPKGFIPVLLAQRTSRFSKASSMAELARGWKSSSILTHIENFEAKRLEEAGVKIGTEFPQTISIKYNHEPQWENHVRMMDANGEEITANDGKPVYRSTSVTDGVADTYEVDGQKLNISECAFDTIPVATVRN